MKLSSFIVIMLCILLMYVIGCNMVSGQKQTMHPPSFWKHLTKNQNFAIEDVRKLFLEDVVQYEQENNYIPRKEQDILRVITFNVRTWKKLNGQSNFEEIGQLMQKLDPDILILQEVGDWEKTHAYYQNHGYNAIAATAFFNNHRFAPIILAKNGEITHVAGTMFKAQSNNKRELSFARMDIKRAGITLTIYGTHFEVDQINEGLSTEKVRKQQLQEILADAQQIAHKNILIAGDFNSVREKDYQYSVNGICCWQLVKKGYALANIPLNPEVLDYIAQKGYLTSFEFINWNNPKFTNWASRVIDFIFLAPGWDLPIVGSYLYYTDLSDHLPIIADFRISK